MQHTQETRGTSEAIVQQSTSEQQAGVIDQRGGEWAKKAIVALDFALPKQVYNDYVNEQWHNTITQEQANYIGLTAMALEATHNAAIEQERREWIEAKVRVNEAAENATFKQIQAIINDFPARATINSSVQEGIDEIYDLCSRSLSNPQQQV